MPVPTGGSCSRDLRSVPDGPGRSLRCLYTKPSCCRDTETGVPQEVCVQGWGSPAPKAPWARGGASLSPLNSLPESQPYSGFFGESLFFYSLYV